MPFIRPDVLRAFATNEFVIFVGSKPLRITYNDIMLQSQLRHVPRKLRIQAAGPIMLNREI